MKFPIDVLQRNIVDAIAAQRAISTDDALHSSFIGAVSHIINCYRLGGRLYIAGNGGSAADAQHLAAEFVSKLARDRSPLPAEALTTDSSILTAIGNDYGYEHLFSRQLEAKLQLNDIFLGISTSGNSLNIIRAFETCKRKGIKTILFSGYVGGKAAQIADYCLIVSGDRTSTIQELHILLAHTLCECVEMAIFPC